MVVKMLPYPVEGPSEGLKVVKKKGFARRLFFPWTAVCVYLGHQRAFLFIVHDSMERPGWCGNTDHVR